MASQAEGGGGGVGGSGGAGAAQRGQMQSLGRQGSLYNLTLDEAQSHLGEPLHSMNMEELQKSVFPDGLHPDGGITSQYKQSSGLREKTVGEVWKEFRDELESNVGDMSLEEFLLRAEEGQLLNEYKKLVYRAMKLHQEGRHSLPGAYRPGRLALQALSAGPGAILESYSDVHITSPMMGEPLHSMNLEELQNSVFPDGQDPDGATTSQYEQSSGLLRQGNIIMPPSMDEVWKDIHDALERNVGEGGGWRPEPEPERQRQRTLGEMTLEEFLVRAGVVTDGYQEDFNDVGNVEQVGSVGVAGLTTEAQWLDHYQHGITAIKPHQDGRHSLPAAYIPGRLALQPLNVGTGAILESYSDGHITSPMMGTLSDSLTPGTKSDSLADKLMERRHQRMINNRKQAYTNELENMVSRLEEENEKLKKQKDSDDWVNSLDDLLHDVTAEPINVQLAVLQDITKNFSDERKIGQGGSGIVYKGVLQTGCVAVKKLLNSQTMEEEPFKREATFLMGVRHKNIVRFLGYCANTEHKFIKMEGSGGRQKPIYSEIRERLLCFDYMSNGGLDSHLTDELGGLEWHTRYQIIKGICEGLQYLHKNNIVHMDLKPANILLDDYMVPKITDFGISRYLDGVSRYVTRQCLVSLGYCAPEYLCGGEVSLKADIFSLGAIIRDIVTGRKQDIDSKNVHRRWRYRWNRSGKYPPLGYQQISKCIEIARSCMVENPKLRPYIWEVIIDPNEEEETNEHITNVVEPMVGQKSPYPWELLEIDPLELNFLFKPNKQIKCSVELNNDRDDYIAFKIQKPSILNYFVEPNKGIVPPHSRSSVIVTLQASNKAPDDMFCKENFVVQCAIVDDGLTAANINEDVFDDTKLGKVVDEVLLTVAFT